MSVRDALTALAQGEAPARGFVLQTCRLEAGGVEHYGHEAVVAAFRTAPLPLGGGTWMEADRGVVVIAPAGCLVADVSEGRIARLWRVDPAEPAAGAMDAAVAFDLDLAQAPADAFLDPMVFDGLSPASADALAVAGAAIARAWLGGGCPAYRARPLPLRAYETPDGAAALFVICWTTGGMVRSSGFSTAVAILPAGGPALTCPPAAAGTG